MAPKRLAADNRSNLISVNVNVSRFNAFRNILNAVVDPRLKAEREAITRCVDVIDYLIKLMRFESCNVQDRAENLTFQLANRIHADQCRSYKKSIGWLLDFGQNPTLRSCFGYMIRNDGLGSFINDRADIGR